MSGCSSSRAQVACTRQTRRLLERFPAVLRALLDTNKTKKKKNYVLPFIRPDQLLFERNTTTMDCEYEIVPRHRSRRGGSGAGNVIALMLMILGSIAVVGLLVDAYDGDRCNRRNGRRHCNSRRCRDAQRNLRSQLRSLRSALNRENRECGSRSLCSLGMNGEGGSSGGCGGPGGCDAGTMQPSATQQMMSHDQYSVSPEPPTPDDFRASELSALQRLYA